MTVSALLSRSLKFRMTCVVILLVLGATLIVASLALALAERGMKGIIGSQQHALLAASAAHVDDQLAARRILMASLADTLPPADSASPDAIAAFIARHPTVRREFLNLVAFDPRGKLVFSTTAATTLLDVATSAYFIDTMGSRKGVISAPFRSRVTGVPVVLVTQPVFDASGAVVLVLAGSIDLQHAAFMQQLDAHKPGDTGFLYIMTPQGVLLHHPDQARLLQHVSERPGRNAATDMALAGFEGWTEAVNKDGSRGIYAYQRMAGAGWIMGARFPVAEAFAPLDQMRRSAMLVAGVFALAAGAVAWLAIAGLLKPLERLRDRLHAISVGGAGIDVLLRRRQDEIGDLSNALHRLMAEREAAQQSTRASEALIRNILERAPDAFVSCDDKGIVTEWNVQAETTFGWRRTEAVGRDIAELIIPPATRDAHRAGMLRFAELGTGPLVNHRVRMTAQHRDGHEVPIELSIGALRHGDTYYATAFLHDATERVRYERQIAAGEQRARLMADNLPALIAYFDNRQHFEFLNATFQQWFGLAPDSLVGQHVQGSMGPRHYHDALPHIERALTGHRATYETSARIDGSAHTLETTMVPDIGADGRVVGVYSLTHDTTRMKEIEQRLIQLARVDTLTGIANRLMFDEILLLAMARARRGGKPMALAYLDIDNFKNINDTLGHGVGDLVLRHFAACLVGTVRATDTVARLAGDEFVIIFEQVTPPDEVTRLAAKIGAAVRNGMLTASSQAPAGVASAIAPAPAPHVTTSIGVVLYQQGGYQETPAELLGRADRALYCAKRNGRDGFALA